MSEERRVSLSTGETVLWTGAPSERVLAVWVVTKALAFTALVAFLTIWGFGFFGGMWAVATGQADRDFNPFASAWRALPSTVPLAFLAGCAYCWALRRTYHYLITNQRVVFVGGLLVRKRRSVHYHKITDVEVSQNPLEQLLGISTLKVFTAGTSGVAGWPWPGATRAEIICPGLVDSGRADSILADTLKGFRATGE